MISHFEATQTLHTLMKTIVESFPPEFGNANLLNVVLFLWSYFSSETCFQYQNLANAHCIVFSIVVLGKSALHSDCKEKKRYLRRQCVVSNKKFNLEHENWSIWILSYLQRLPVRIHKNTMDLYPHTGGGVEFNVHNWEWGGRRLCPPFWIREGVSGWRMDIRLRRLKSYYNCSQGL